MVLASIYSFPSFIYLFIFTVLQPYIALMPVLINSALVRLHKAIWLAIVEGHHKTML